jgi:hypothetical protein
MGKINIRNEGPLKRNERTARVLGRGSDAGSLAAFLAWAGRLLGRSGSRGIAPGCRMQGASSGGRVRGGQHAGQGGEAGASGQRASARATGLPGSCAWEREGEGRTERWQRLLPGRGATTGLG